MKYSNIEKGIFRSRPNRFIAHVEINGREEVVHVKNTGRCRELLPEGAEVFCQRSDKAERKTAFDAFCLAADAARCFITDGIDLSMNRYNRKDQA